MRITTLVLLPPLLVQSNHQLKIYNSNNDTVEKTNHLISIPVYNSLPYTTKKKNDVLSKRKGNKKWMNKKPISSWWDRISSHLVSSKKDTGVLPEVDQSLEYKNNSQKNNSNKGRQLYDESYDEYYTGDTTNTQTNKVDLLSRYGTIYVDVWIGTPIQSVTMAMSLTSDYTIMPCDTESADCGSDCSRKFFQSTSSTSFKSISCDQCTSTETTDESSTVATCDTKSNNCIIKGNILAWNQTSWSATLSSDMAYVGGAPIEGAPDMALRYGFNFTFGCQRKETSDSASLLTFISKKANGIMSFSPNQNSLTQHMYAASKVQNPNFSVCFKSEKFKSSTSGGGGDILTSPAGILTLGGYILNADSGSSPLIHARIPSFDQSDQPSYYTVHIRNIYLRKSSSSSSAVASALKLSLDTEDDISGSAVAVIDSGSPVTFLSSSILSQSFRDAWTTLTGEDYTNKPLLLTENDLLGLPTILIQLEAASDDKSQERKEGMVGELDYDHPTDLLLSIKPINYMDYESRSGKYRSGIFLESNDDKSKIKTTVLGANAMRSKLLYFDLDSKKLGVAEQIKCERYTKPVNQEEKPSDPVVDEGPPLTMADPDSSPNTNTNTEDGGDVSRSPGFFDYDDDLKPLDEMGPTLESFSFNVMYYIASASLITLYVSLGIYNLWFHKKLKSRNRSSRSFDYE